MKRLLLFLIPLLILFSCAEEQRTEPIQLRQIVKSSESTSSFYGGYFLIGGAVSGESSVETSVEVFGLYQGMYQYFKFPIESVRIKIDDTVDIPYVVITYLAECELDVDRITGQNGNRFYNVKYIIVCPERYLPEQLLPIKL